MAKNINMLYEDCDLETAIEDMSIEIVLLVHIKFLVEKEMKIPPTKFQEPLINKNHLLFLKKEIASREEYRENFRKILKHSNEY